MPDMVIITATTIIIMAETERLIRLFSWLSPAFPTGGFAYSQGLETAIATRRVCDAATLAEWIEGQAHLGFLRTDAVFLALAARAASAGDRDGFDAVGELCLALQISDERDRETREQARSFIEAAQAWPAPMPDWLAEALGEPMALPITFGALAGIHAIALRAAVSGFANAAIAQQVSVGVRLIPLGQTAGLAIQARMEPDIAWIADAAVNAGIDDIAGLSYGADVASLRHEDLNVRIFRS